LQNDNGNDNDNDNDNEIPQKTPRPQQRPSKWTPETMLPGKTLAEVEAVYKQKRAAAVKKGRTKLVKALDRAIGIRRKQFGASPGKPAQTTPGRTPDRTPSGKTPMQTTPERNAEYLLPGKTEQAVRRIHAERRAAAVKKGDKELVARLERALPIRLQRLKSQGANVLGLSVERVLPGKTLEEVEKTYKERRAVAVSKGRTALVKALNRAIGIRRKQFGASPGKTAQTTPVRSPTGKTPMQTTPERNAEYLLPGKTEQAVRRIHAERRAAAAKKGDKELVARLERALPIRLQRLKSQGANVLGLSVERVLPGKTLQEVEKTYKERRAVAVSKGRTALVQALDRAIGIRRKQFGSSPGKAPPSPSKTSQSTSGKVPPSPSKTSQSTPGKVPPSPSKTSQSTPGKVPPSPEQLLPGKTLAQVEAEYAKRRASAVAKKRTGLVQALNRAIVERKKQFATSPGKSSQQSSSKVFRVPPERLIPGKTIAEIEAVYAKRRASAVVKKRTDLVQALNRAIVERKKQFAASPGKVPQKLAEEAKAKAESDRARAEAEKAKAKAVEAKKSIEREIISKKRKIKDVEKKAQQATKNIGTADKGISDATVKRQTRRVEKLTRFSRKRQQNLQSAQQAKGRLITELRGLEQKSAQITSSLAQSQRSAPQQMRSPQQARSAPQQMRSPQQARSAPQQMRSPQQARSAPQQMRSAPQMRSAQQPQRTSSQQMMDKAKSQIQAQAKTKAQSVGKQLAEQAKAKAQSALAQSSKQMAEQAKAKAQSALAQSSKQMAEQAKAKAQSFKLEQEKRQKSAKLEQEKRQKSAKLEQEKRQQIKAQSAKLEQEKRQKFAKLEQEKRQQIKAQSAKLEQVKKQQIQARTAQKKQMRQPRPMMRPQRRR